MHINNTQVCAKCRTSKDIEEFHKNQRWCKKCSSDASKEWYQDNKDHKNRLAQTRVMKLRVWLVEMKQGMGCHFCKEDYFRCLEFHHTNSEEKEHNVSDMVANGFGKEAIQREMAKCICVCSNCHRKLHDNVLQYKDTTFVC